VKIGLVGLPGSGKTTIFSALTGLAVETGPGGRVKTNLGAVKVPDQRVDRLSSICKPKKTTFAEITFADVAGEGKPQEGYFDPQRTSAMREMDVLAQIVSGFEDGAARAARDIRSFATEMHLQDLMLVERRLERLKKEKGKPREEELLLAVKTALEADRPVRMAGLAPNDLAEFSGFRFLSEKPLLIVMNVAESAAAEPPPAEVLEAARAFEAPVVVLSGAIEREIAELPPGERPTFLESLGLSEPAVDRFIRAAFEAARLIVFFTIGEDEVRAWPVLRDSPAPHAAGRIHTDLEKGFIRAEVIKYDDFVTLGSELKCREQGKQRSEGRDYVVKDGDILHIRFSR
jgi:ribosome-binding ATPase